MLALELTKVGCTIVDAEEFVKAEGSSKLVKTAFDPMGIVKSLASLGGGSALAVGATGGIAGYGMYDSMKDSDSKERKKLVEIEQYRQAIRDLQAARQHAPQF